MKISNAPISLKPRHIWDWIAFGICLSAFFLWGILLTQKYYFLGYYDWDLALYAQAMWNLCRGEFYSSLFDINFLANHAEYISFFLAPVYAVFNHPLTLVYMKIFSYSLGAYILFHIAKPVLSEQLSLVFMLLYLIFPANIYAVLYEFHIESVNIAFLFLLFYFFERKALVPFYITAFFTALIKENMSPIVVTFGIYALFSRRDKLRWGVVPIIFGALMFYLAMVVITPFLRQDIGSANGYLYLYSYLGNTPLEIIKNSFSHPEKIFAVLFEAERTGYINEFLRPFAYAPILNPHILFLISPVILQHMLSPAHQYHVIFYHYAATLAPFFFLATLVTLKTIKDKVSTVVFDSVFLVVLFCSILNFSIYIGDIRQRVTMFENPRSRTAVEWDMIKQVPPEAGVITTLGYLAPLAQRKSLYSFLSVADGYRSFSGKKPILEPSINYALINLSDPWISDKVRFTKDTAGILRMRDFLSSGWKVQDIVEDIVLLKRNPIDDFRLVERSFEPFESYNPSSSVLIDKKFRLLAFEPGHAPSAGKQTVLPIVFHWKAESPIPSGYGIQLIFMKDGKEVSVRKRFIGYTFCSTLVWQAEEYVKETYYLSMVNLPPGEYEIRAYFVELAGGSFYKINCSALESSHPCSQGVVPIGQLTIPPKFVQ